MLRHTLMMLWASAGLAASAMAADETADSVSLTFETVWRIQTGAVVYGGVTTDGNRLYVGDEQGRLLALDPESGETAWEHRADAGIASAAAVDGQRIYFQTRAGRVHALDKTDGRRLWSFSTDGERRWDYWDYYLSTPAVDDRQIYFGSGDHHVYALDKGSGELRWRFRTGNIVHGEPVLSGEKVLVGGFEGRLYALDRADGRRLWAFKTVGTDYFRNGAIPGTAAVADGRVYFGGRDYNVYALLEETGTGAWNDKTPSWIVGRPLVAGDDLIVVNSDGARVISYQRKSGRKNWEFKHSYNMFAGAAALGTKHVIVAGLDGRLTALALEDGSVAGSFETEGSRRHRDRYFQEDGTVNYTGVTSLDDLMDLYDRQLADLGGLTGRLAVADDMVYYAAANGEVGAIRVGGAGLPEAGQD